MIIRKNYNYAISFNVKNIFSYRLKFPSAFKIVIEISEIFSTICIVLRAHYIVHATRC